MNIPEVNLPRVVVIGGGFAGLQIVRQLRKHPYQVVLIDKHNYHTFQPLLYQVATSGLEPDSIGYPIRKIFEGHRNFLFRLAEVASIDPEIKVIDTSIGILRYDYLVVATGSDTNFFGNKGLEDYAMPMKSIPEALNIRSLLLQNFEEALLTSNLKEREALMNVVIVGAGPTGVELSGAISELRKHILPHDYPDLDVRRMSVHLIEAGPRVLPAMSEEASENALQALKRLDVEVWLNTMVQDYDGRLVMTKDGRAFHTRTLIWAAGVKGVSPDGIPAESLVRGGRIEVNRFSEVRGLHDIYAVGDIAMMSTEAYPHGHPMVASVAIQQARHLAKNLIAKGKDREMEPFVYDNPGAMATIGRNKAVVDLHRFKFKGAFAWLVWMLVHVVQLIGFRNKLLVMINWTWNYVRYARDARLIIRPYHRSADANDTPRPS